MNRLRVINHMITSLDTEKAFNKIQHHFMTKIIGMGAACLNIINVIYEKSLVSIICNGERIQGSHLD